MLVTAIVLHLYTKRIRLFERSDLGMVQKWIQALIALLVCFDDPMCLMSHIFGKLYYICQGFMESLFIATLLLFWLIIIHSMSTRDGNG